MSAFIDPIDPIDPTDVPSPCISVCHIEQHSGWCLGCWRSIDEIAGWGAMSDPQKRVVWTLLPQRRHAQLARDAGLFDAS